jgi:hypothetical protein
VRLSLSQIRLDGGTQTRAGIDLAVANEYADAFRAGVKFPPVIVFHDGSTYWLADGFHRVTGADSVGLAEIEADVRQGTRRDAILFSVGANAVHGLRRTNADKRRAVETLLRDEEWRAWSDRVIAEKSGTSHPFVAKVRAEAVASGNDYQMPEVRTVERNGVTYQQNTASIGKSTKQEAQHVSTEQTAPVLESASEDSDDDDLPDIERDPDVYNPEPTPLRRDPAPRSGWASSDIARFTSETIIWMRGVQEEARRRFGAIDPRFVRESRSATQDVVLETIETLRALLPEDAPAPKLTILRGGK